MATEPNTAGAAKDKSKEKPSTKKRVKGITQDAKLTIVATENKKRGASATRFQAYLDKKPKTVKEALAAGLTMGDIHYDHIHGSIKVEGATVEEYTPTARGARTPKAPAAGGAAAAAGDGKVF